MQKKLGIKKIGCHNLHNRCGTFLLTGYHVEVENQIAICLSVNQNYSEDEPYFLRVQYGCLNSTAFFSTDCDCSEQMRMSLSKIAQLGRGVLVYFPYYEAYGLGLHKKILFDEQNLTHEKISVSTIAKKQKQKILNSVPLMLDDLGFHKKVVLISNSPQKIDKLGKAGIEIIRTENTWIDLNWLSTEGKRELIEKIAVLHHMIETKFE